MVVKGGLFVVSRKRLIAVAVSACFAAEAGANPTAPQVVSGSAGFAQKGNALTVTNSNGAIINWNTFSIGAGESTRFNQVSASSSVLNRVLANDPSVILGTLSSNGRVWLVNPAGIMVGQGARIDVGAFIASTLNVRNEDFLAGRLSFQATPGAGKLENHGTITTPSGGSVYLIAPSVENHGVINAPNGEVILAAGQKVELIDTGTPGVKVEIVGSEGDVTNLGTIASEAGRIGMAGVLVKNSGMLNASSVVTEGGRMFLKATRKIELAGTSVIAADGTKGGLVIAKTEEGGQLSGEFVGGGRISAQGNGAPGSGGFVETSAKWADINSVRVNTRGGTWLLDPDDVEIHTTGTIGGATLVTPATIQAALATGNFVVQTSAGGTGGNGDIFVNSAFSWSDPNTLTLNAIRDINFNQGMTYGGGLTLSAGGNVNITNSFVNTASGGALSVSGAALNVTASTAAATLQGSSMVLNMTGNVSVAASASGAAQLLSTGAQSITANGIVVQGAASGSANSAQILASGTQNFIVGTSGVTLTGGNGTNNFAKIAQLDTTATQTITVTGGGITANAGGASGGSGNSALLIQSGIGLQHVTADSIQLAGGGGAAGLNNQALIETVTGATASQQIDIGTGGLMLQGGTGSAGGNRAGIWGLANSAANVTQAVTLSGTGHIAITGGNSSVGTTSTTSNDAGIFQSATGAGASQAITLAGAGGITLTGGSSGATNTGYFSNNAPNQTISLGGGALVVAGGVGTNGGNEGSISSAGTAVQSILFTAPGSISLTGGTGAIANTATKGNRAFIFASAGTQSIAGNIPGNNPDITVTGGASGGNTSLSATNLGHSAFIQEVAGTQQISAGAIQVFGGATGVDNSGTIQAPTQTIGATSVTITGGGTTGTFGGARIGGIGGTSPGPTNLNLTTAGNIIVTGGSGSGAAIGATQAGGVTTGITINSGGDVTLTPGSVGGARIGSGSASVMGGDIYVTAAGNITLNGNGAVGTAILTTGDVTLMDAVGTHSIFEDIAGIIKANKLTTVSQDGTVLNGANQLSAFQATNNTTGNIVLNNTAPTLAITGIAQNGPGNITVANAGALNITGTVSAGSAATSFTTTGANDLAVTGGNVNVSGPLILASGRHVTVQDAYVNTSGAVTLSGTDLNVIASATSSTLQGASMGATMTGNINITANLSGGALLASLGAETISANGITLQAGASGSNNNASLAASGIQALTVGAGGVQITGGSGGTNNNASINQNSAGGTQTISVTGGNVSVLGGAATDTAQIWNNGSAQNLTLLNSGNLNIVAAAGLANISSQGSQTISLTGGGANAIQVGNASASESSWISANGIQSITAGSGVELGSISILGGTGAGKWANIGINSGPAAQTISTSGTLSLTGGSAVGGTTQCIDAGMCVQIYNNTTGVQTISAKGVVLQGGASGLDNSVSIGANGQSLTVGSGGIQIAGGAGGTNNTAGIFQNASGGTQMITVTGGNVSVLGGAATDFAQIWNNGTSQTLTLSNSNSLDVIAAAGSASINSQAAQTIGFSGTGAKALTVGGTGSADFSSISGSSQNVSAGTISVIGGSADGKNASIRNNSGTQTITAAGSITLTGGTASGVSGGPSDCANVGACVFLDQAGAGVQSITAGSIDLHGGSSGGFNIAAIQAFNPSASQSITITGGGTMSLTGGSGSGTKNAANVYTSGTSQSVSFTSGGALQLTGGTVGSANVASLQTTGAGSQTIGTGSILMQGGASGTNNSASINTSAGSSGQTLTVGVGGIVITGGAGAGGGDTARINQNGAAGTQTINVAGNVALTGGAGHATNNAQIFNQGSAQNVTLTNADFLDVKAGAGQAFISANFASGSSAQTISLTGAGLNAIHIGAPVSAELSGLFAGASQNITAGTGLQSGSITVLGGATLGKSASISVSSLGTTQTVSTSGQISLTGGTSTSSANGNSTSCSLNGSCAGIFNSGTGLQSISASGIAMQGGANGWYNRALIGANNSANSAGNSQQITVGAGGISLIGGGGATAADDNNYAQIFLSSNAASQTITVNNGGTVQLQGGSSAGTAGNNGSFAHISDAGISQMLSFTSGGNLILTGGTVGYRNSARFEYSGINTQTIGGSPSVMLLGGASGGNTLAGTIRSNSANILADNGTQNITSGPMSVIAGPGGIDSNATIAAPVQSITVNGDLSLAGSASTGSFAGARIGGRGGVAPSTTNLTLNATGNISLTGGSATGASIGSNGLGGVNTDMFITAGGDFALTPGSGAGVRIGSPLGAVAGGNISISAGGNISLNGAGAVGTSIRTTGDVTLIEGVGTHSIFEDVAGVIQANKLTTASVDGTVLNGANLIGAFQATNTGSGNIVLANSGALTIAGINQAGNGSVAVANAGALTIGSGAVLSTAGSGDALVLSGQGFTNNSGPSALQTPNGRWLVYSVDPTTDVVGGLNYGFKQYAAAPGNPVFGAGNGLLYSVAPLLTPSLAGTASKLYDATTLASLLSANVSISGAINADTAALGTPAGINYNDKNVGVLKTVTASGLSIASAFDSNGKPVFGYQLSASSVSAAIGTITPAPLTVTAQANVRVYDSTTSAAATPTISSGALFGTDTAVLSEAYADKNAGTGKTLAPTAVISDGNSGANYAVTLVDNSTGTITPAPLTVTGASANSKVYDGNTTAIINTGAAVASGVFSGDAVTLNGGTGRFADRNIGTAKSVTVAGLALGGADGGNYVVANPVGLGANIAQLASVAWTGGASGDWSQASNWAGGALPDGNNVLGVTIPAGSAVTYDAGAANSTLNTLNSSGALILAGGAGSVLTVNAQLATDQFAMSSGSLAGSGNLTVTTGFAQTGGNIALGGAATAALTQAAGDLIVGNLSAPGISLVAQTGGIAQSGAINAVSLATNSVTGTSLTNSGNRIASFTAANNGSGIISLVNTGALNIGGITNAGGGISVTNTGALTTSGLVSANGGSVSLVANSPLTIGSAGITATGNIALTAGATLGAGDDLILAGPVSSTGAGSAIVLTAGDNLAQNANVTSNGGNVSANALTGSISMSADASTATAGGSIGYAASSGNMLLASLNAGSGPIGVSAGGNLAVTPGASGANLIGASAIIAAGGNAILTTRVGLLDVTVGGSFTITDAITGTVLSDAPAVPASVQTTVAQVVSAIVATTQSATVSASTSTTSSPTSPPASTAASSTTSQTPDASQTAGATGGASSLKLIAVGFSAGGTEGTFGGPSSAGSSGSSSGSSGGGTSGSFSGSSSGGSSGGGSDSSGSGSSGGSSSSSGSSASGGDSGKSASSDSGKSSSSEGSKSSSSDGDKSSSSEGSKSSSSDGDKSADSKADKKDEKKDDKKDDKKKDDTAQGKKSDSKAPAKKPASCG